MITKTVKIVALVLAVIIILCTLSACDGGTPGPAGAQDEKGDQGEKGVGIEKVEYDAKGNLVITFTDGSTQTVTMPENDNNTSENASSGFKYTIYSDKKSCGIESIGVCTDTEIIIPDKIDGCIVVTIGERAFENCTNVTSIKIPETVTSIGASAFYGCSNLKELDLPAGITKIGDRAFQQCSSLEKLVIPDGVTGLGMCMFYGDSNLKEIQLSKQLTSIGLWAFDGCENLEKLIIPKTVTSMDVAFLGCNKLSIFCEIAEQPQGWEHNWSCCWSHSNGTDSCTIVWGYKGD